MTAVHEASLAFARRMQAEWTATPFQLPNETFAPREGESYVRLFYQYTISRQDCLGKRTVTRRGRLFFQIYTSIDIGVAGTRATPDSPAVPNKIDDLTSLALGLFEQVSFDGISTEAAVPQQLGREGRWYKTNISIPFTFQDTK